uniref:Uncharacterized protein n=1 Tax=Rhizophora mucronata TaxID=61149 RepID=A0A2P2PGC2_RHIMU
MYCISVTDIQKRKPVPSQQSR